MDEDFVIIEAEDDEEALELANAFFDYWGIEVEGE
jgi:hypothetical protein